MVRKQLFITAAQQRRLKELARQTGTVEADLIRAGIDMKLAEVAAAAKCDWRERLADFVAGWKDNPDFADRPDIGDRISAARKRQRKQWAGRMARLHDPLADK